MTRGVSWSCDIPAALLAVLARHTNSTGPRLIEDYSKTKRDISPISVMGSLFRLGLAWRFVSFEYVVC